MTSQKWVSIIGWESVYSVSNDGLVRSERSGLILKPEIFRKNYRRVKLQKNGNTQNLLVHRIVALHFVHNPDKKPFVNHLDNDHSNNHFTNLEWCTQFENIQHAIKIGAYNPRKNGYIGHLKRWGYEI